jgi:hypothetical protein
MTDPQTDTAWYRRPKALVAVAAVVLAIGLGVGFVLAADDDGTEVDTVGTTAATTPVAPATTAAAPATTAPPPPATTSPEDGCAAGDQVACDRLDDDVLEEYCDDGNVDACQVLLARQGDGIPDGDEGRGNGNGNNGNGRGNGGPGGGGDDDDD